MKTVSSEVPTEPTLAAITTAISAANRPYSMAEAPSSSFQNFDSRV